MSTAGRRSPQAIGIAAPRLRRKTIRDEMPSSAAKDFACASHGASSTSSVRRDIHCTARTPATSRPRINSAPIIHTPKRVAGKETRVRVDAGVLTNALEAESGELGAGSWELEAESWEPEAGSWELGAESCELEAGSCELEAGSRELEAGSGKLEADSIVTKSSCQRGSAIDSAGRMRTPTSASVQTMCRIAAERPRRRNDASPAVKKTIVAFATASATAIHEVPNPATIRSRVLMAYTPAFRA